MAKINDGFDFPFANRPKPSIKTLPAFDVGLFFFFAPLSNNSKVSTLKERIVDEQDRMSKED